MRVVLLSNEVLHLCLLDYWLSTLLSAPLDLLNALMLASLNVALVVYAVARYAELAFCNSFFSTSVTL